VASKLFYTAVTAIDAIEQLSITITNLSWVARTAVSSDDQRSCLYSHVTRDNKLHKQHITDQQHVDVDQETHSVSHMHIDRDTQYKLTQT